jgi:LysR family transcriptional regulator, glycine cleavage system transcriptional activator
MIEQCSIKDAGVTLIATPRIPSLAVLRAVEATVRHGSVSRAARELIVTDGAVSRAVREFEADLGFALFERRSRLIVATPTARRLADEVRIALDHLGGAVARARRSGSPTGPLVLSCEPTFLIRWLIPRLGCLQRPSDSTASCAWFLRAEPFLSRARASTSPSGAPTSR